MAGTLGGTKAVSWPSVHATAVASGVDGWDASLLAARATDCGSCGEQRPFGAPLLLSRDDACSLNVSVMADNSSTISSKSGLRVPVSRGT